MPGAILRVVALITLEKSVKGYKGEIFKLHFGKIEEFLRIEDLKKWFNIHTNMSVNCARCAQRLVG